MLPLNYAILRLFLNDNEYDVNGVMEKLKDEYSSFRAFKPAGVNESLMSAEKNGLLEESRFELDDSGKLNVYYKATEYGVDMITQYIK